MPLLEKHGYGDAYYGSNVYGQLDNDGSIILTLPAPSQRTVISSFADTPIVGGEILTPTLSLSVNSKLLTVLIDELI